MRDAFMNIQSMTGFARTEAGDGQANWIWEIRSVNGKGLDTRFRLPGMLDRLEPTLRRIVQATIARGSVQVALHYDGGFSRSVPVLNDQALEAAIDIVDTIAERTGSGDGKLAAILAMKGVVEQAEPPEPETVIGERDRQLTESFKETVAQLVAMREAEGGKIAAVLAAQIDSLEKLADALKMEPSRSAEVIAERLREQVARLVDQSGIDQDRLYQEAAILATKADLQEEIDRIESHVTAARDLLSSGGVVGRKLDFLAQEFNRESNTICSKSNAAPVTRIGLEMKVLIDQFREQVQNIQ